MYGIFAYIWLIFMVGKYTVHVSYGSYYYYKSHFLIPLLADF